MTRGRSKSVELSHNAAVTGQRDRPFAHASILGNLDQKQLFNISDFLKFQELLNIEFGLRTHARFAVVGC
jgi:hypothetical protein